MAHRLSSLNYKPASRKPSLLSLLSLTSLLTGAACSSSGLTVGPMDPIESVSLPPLVFSEIMYHPVDENAPVDNHEFLEIYNRSASAVDLGGWRITGNVDYTFPAGVSIPANGYKVIAKNKSALAAIKSYMLQEGELLGDYGGELDNGGGTVNLLNPQAETVDSVTYSDQFPWPYGTDEMGATDRWLGMLPMPQSQAPHQYRGRSLERVSFEVPASEISNWVPSPLDGATPGRKNSQSGTPPAIVLTKKVSWSGSDVLIRAADTVKISVGFSTLGPVQSPQLQYFVDNVEVTDEPITTVAMILNNGVWEASLPPQKDNSIVRYRIQADRGAGVEVVSPRDSDPFAWWAYFVTPKVTSNVSLYQLFIKKSNWNQMYDNINFGTDDRRVQPGGSSANRCLLRDSWDATVPAVFVINGVVHDVFVRYQGSRYNRTNGFSFDPSKTTISPLPDRPTNTILSWKVDFPDYALFEDKRHKLVLNKMRQACPGLDDSVGERLYGDPSIDIPVQRTRYARFHINGGYYHLMLDLEHIDEDMIKRYRAPNEPIGDLFKSDGNGNVVEGPWGPGDESPLPVQASCPMWTVDDRYAYTYQRLTNKWDGPAEVRKMIETINTLRAAAATSGDYTALRSYFMANFDYQKLLDYVAIRNWAQTWDDQFHNHFLYQRLTDKKWVMIPQDKDLEFGEFFGWGPPLTTGRSFYLGEVNDIDNRGGAWNRVKDAFIKSFRTELRSRLVELDANGVLNPVTFKAKVDEGAATFSVTDYNASPAALPCSLAGEIAPMKSFADCRHQDVLDLAADAACAGSCGLKAEYYQTQAGDMTRSFANATLRTTRTDAQVNFDIGGAPVGTVPADGWQVRWTGKITPRTTGVLTFYVYADEGVRLFVDGKTLIDQWTAGTAAREIAVSTPTPLNAGTPVTITMEYFDSAGGSTARLMWGSPSPCKQPVPASRLAPM